MKILVTGSAGFIGFHLAKRFCERGDEVLGIDNLNDYYDVSLKHARLRQLEPFKNFRFMKMDIADRPAMEALFNGCHCEPAKLFGGRSNLIEGPFDRVVHMAAQAGVRYSIQNPHAYIQSNLVGFLNILEGCRSMSLRGATATKQSQDEHGIATAPSEPRNDFHLVYASSSSVYGLNTKMPFSVTDRTDTPVSLYGATKKANELMAHSYSHLYGIPTTGLRFFTVYGPWGRPDMALFKFTKAILNGEPIDVYNHGKMRRDFTYIDDIVEGVVRVTDKIATPYCIYNIGNNNPVDLADFISATEDALGKKAEKRFLSLQPGDVLSTYADVDDLMKDVSFSPSTPIKVGIKKFIDWYLAYQNEWDNK